MVRSGEEKDRFGDLKPVFMSEESDPDENDTIEVHKPVWRSSSK